MSVLAVGTLEGAPIPRVTGGFVTDNRGRIALPRLEAASLRALANAGGGRFAVLSADDRDLEVLLSGEVIAAAASEASLATDRWREEGPWLLLLLLPIAALAFRRGWVLMVLVFVLPLPQPAAASLWETLTNNLEILFKSGNNLFKGLFINSLGCSRRVEMYFIYTFCKNSAKSPSRYAVCDFLDKILFLLISEMNIGLSLTIILFGL